MSMVEVRFKPANELSDAYERLSKRRELYKKATQRGDSISGIGVLILLSSIFVLPWFPEGYFNLLYLSKGGIIMGGIMIGVLFWLIGQMINRRVSAPPKLSAGEEEFLKVFEALKNIEMYREQGTVSSRTEAAKTLSKVEGDMLEPSSISAYSLWQALTKEVDEELRFLKRNLKERLIPSVTQGKAEDIEKAYSITEKFAKYLLKPTASEVRGLNESMSELKPSLEEKVSPLPSFDRHPNLRHFIVLTTFGLSGLLVFYIGVNFLHTSIDNAYIAGTALFGTLTAGYIAIPRRKG